MSEHLNNIKILFLYLFSCLLCGYNKLRMVRKIKKISMNYCTYNIIF